MVCCVSISSRLGQQPHADYQKTVQTPHHQHRRPIKRRALMTGPDQSKLIAIGMGHSGSIAEGEAAARPIKEFCDPVMDTIGPISYTQLNMLLDASFPKGARNYWKSHFLAGLTDEAIATLIDQFQECPLPMAQVIIEHFHGAPTRIEPSATAYTLREEGYNLAFVTQWMDSADDEQGIPWTRNAYDAMNPYVAKSRYLNYMDQDDADDAVVASVYGPNVERLRSIKTIYDPENLFHLNLNILPHK